jgi:hypothetical protein
MPPPTFDSLLPVTDGTLTIDSDSAPGSILGEQLSRLTGGAPIIVQSATRSTQGNVVQVTGKAAFLKIADLPVTVTAVAGDDGPAITLRFTLIDGPPGPNPWLFSRSFPDLPAFNIALSTDNLLKDEDQMPSVNLLDRLPVADAAFVLTTLAAGTDPVTGAPVQAGLNFVARCVPAGLVGLLGSVANQATPISLSGPILVPRPTEATLPMAAPRPLTFPWESAEPVPGIDLRADLGIDGQLGQALRLSDVNLRVYCPPTQAWSDANPAYFPVLAATATLAIPSASLSVNMTALGLTSLSSMILVGRFEGVTLGKLEQLADVMGAGDLASCLPDDVRQGLAKLDALSLDAMTLQLGWDLAVNCVGVNVGLRGIDTKVLPGVTLQGLTAAFSVVQPFGPGRALSAQLGGSITFAGVPLDITVDLPEIAARARTTAGVNLPLRVLFQEIGLPAPPDLTIDELQLGIARDGSRSIFATLAKSSPWTIDLGPVPLTISDVTVFASKPASGSASASFSGGIALGDDLELAISCQTPGDFSMQGELPDVRLLELAGKLTNQSLALPGGFDLAFTDSSVLIVKAGADLTFRLATSVATLGTVAFEARRVSSGQNTWGFAVGVDLSGAGLSSLPGLGALKAFEDFFHLDELLLVVASFSDPSFTFPSLAAFNSPNIQSGNLKLPAQAGGVIAGLNVYARWTIDTRSREQALLRSVLGLNPTLGITLQIGTNPSADSRLYVSYNTTIQGHSLSCQFGGQMSNGQVGLFLTGTLLATIQGQPVRFDVTMLFVANGAFISGSMLGSVTFEGLTLSNLAVVIGINWEGIPSLGIAATLTASRFQSSLAFFFDSTDPSRSMLAGALSDLSLKDVLDTFAGAVIPSEIDAALSDVAVEGTNSFSIDAGLAAALDHLQLDLVAAAFASHGVTIPGSSAQVLVVVGKPGKSWFLTDMTTMRHYGLAARNGAIQVSLEAQFYCAPQATSIGTLRFPQGFFVDAGLNIFGLHASAMVLIWPSQGIALEGAMNRIVLGSEALFSIESNDGKSGPRLSAATFNQPQASVRGPHFQIDGRLNLLGLMRGATIKLTNKQFEFDINGTLLPGFDYDLRGHFNGPANLGAGGSVKIGLGAIDLGPLGTAHIDTGVQGTLDVGVRGSNLWAKVTGGFEFAGARQNLPALDLNTNTSSLLDLPAKLRDAVVRLLKQLLADPAKWLSLVSAGAITGVTDIANVLKTGYGMAAQQAATLLRKAGWTAEAVAKGFRSAYGIAAGEIAALLSRTGYPAGPVAGALKAAYGSTVEQTVQALKGAGYAVNDVAGALSSAYGVAADRVAGLLRGAGCAAAEVAAALRSVYGLNDQQAARALKAVGYAANEAAGAIRSAYGATAEQTARALKTVGFAANEAAGALRSAYGATAEQTAQALKGAGYAANETAGALRSAYGFTAEQTARALKGMGYAANETAGALRSAYGATAKQAAQALKGAGYAVNEVGGALQKAYNATANEVTGALKGAGYAVNEVGRFVQKTFNLAPAALNSVLTGAGYAAKEVGGFFKDLGGSFASFGNALDPTKW